MKTYILILAIIVFGSSDLLHAQTPKSTKGKRFYISWPYIVKDTSMSCHFSIHSQELFTNGKVVTPDTSFTFTLSDSNQFSISTINFTRYFKKYKVDNSEMIEDKGVYIETDNDVSAFIHSFSNYGDISQEKPCTGESALVLPIESLSSNYLVVTKSEENSSSYFLVLAIYDSTEIVITPSKKTLKGKPANIPFSIILNKGQTYLVESSNADLTGSRVSSKNSNKCKPISVFVGASFIVVNKNTNIFPLDTNSLLEQMLPIELFGKRYITPAHLSRSTNTPCILRIMAIEPQTLVYLNGNQIGGLLSGGNFIDITTDKQEFIYSEKPIIVVQFTISNPTETFPSMLILNSLEQMTNKTVLPRYWNNAVRVFGPDRLYSYINIITRFSDRNSTKINGQKIDPSLWKIIPENPIFCSYTHWVPRDSTSFITNDIGGILCNLFSHHHPIRYTLSGGALFTNSIFGGIDTTEIYANTNYCQKGVSIFSAKSDTTATNFLWEFGDGGKGEGKTVEHIYQQPGQYALKLIIYRDAFCSYDTVRKTITVRASPVVKAGIRPTILLCNGQTATLGTNQLPGVTYRWSPAIGLSDTTVGQPTVTALSDSVKYYVLAYDQFGCESRDSIVVKLYDPPIANAGPDTVSCGGNGVQIGRATTGGTPQYSFLWTPSTGLSNPNIERPIAAPTITTTYILRVTDVNSCVDYDTVEVQALSAPTIDAGNPVTICEGDSVQLNASGANLYRWLNARNINDTTIGNPMVYPSVTTTYYVAGLFPTGCVAFDSVLVTVTPKPRLPIAFQTTACPNATKTYTVENRNNLTYNWEINGGNLSTGQGTNEATVVWGAGPTGSIKLTTTTTAGSCSFDTVVAITISSDIKPTITENKKNTVVPSLGTVRICPNESVTLDVGVGYTEITWTNGSTNRQTTVSTEGWYGVSVKDATGCSGGDSVFVEVVLPPSVFAGNDRVLCGADSAVMRGNVTGSGNYTYQWIPPTAVSDPTALVTNFIAPNTTQLIFQAIDTVNGCITSDTVLMTILSISNNIITTSKGSNILCFGEQMSLDAGAFDSYTWSTGETTRTITITSGGSYWVDAKSGSCSAIDTIQIIQNPQIIVTPTPDITASPGATVTLDANATGGTFPYQFQWTPEVNFVDPSNLQSTRVTASVGSQTYIVTVTDDNDCVARDTIMVFVPSTSTTVTVARREVSASALNVNFPLTLTLDPNTPITPTGFSATLTVPFEQFIPKSVTNGTMTMTQTATDYVVNITVPIDEPLYNNSVITELIGDILLGQQDSTPILISNAQWQGTTYPVNGVNGTIVLNDVCYSGTRRYLLPTTIGFGIMSINPNPAQHSATFEFGIIEAGKTTFEIIDVFGNVMHSTEFNRESATPKGGTTENRYTHIVDVSSFPSGTYYGVLRSFSQRESVPLVKTK